MDSKKSTGKPAPKAAPAPKMESKPTAPKKGK